MTITANQVAALSRKCKFTSNSENDFFTLYGKTTKRMWGEDKDSVNIAISESAHCCGLGVLTGFDVMVDDPSSPEVPVEMAILIRKALRASQSRRRTTYYGEHSAGYAKFMATLSTEVYKHNLWLEALKYNGFEVVGQPKRNPKTGNRIWLLAK